jgi:3'-phosphoadenosine 5'-phosphosulfate sulfotransferase (PAPS reductase)/FAD synthetase
LLGAGEFQERMLTILSIVLLSLLSCTAFFSLPPQNPSQFTWALSPTTRMAHSALTYATTPAFEDAKVLYARLQEFSCSNHTAKHDKLLANGLKTSLESLGQTLRLFGARAVVTSFNGGKDAVVILHLVRAAMAKFALDEAREMSSRDIEVGNEGLFESSLAVTALPPRVLYFDVADDFDEVRAFVATSARDLALDMITFAGDVSFKDGLRTLVEAESFLPEAPSCNQGGQSRTRRPLAFVLGTRAGDPNSRGQGVFSPSSDWMPPFMRVNPVL